MSEGEGSRKVRKSGSPKVRRNRKSEVESPKSEEKNSALDIPNSEQRSHLEHLEETDTSEKIKHPKRRSPLEHREKTKYSEKSEITIMEVHHHPQLEHKPKPWKEYILEGLMIFLAVFMGFIAENIREHIVEKNRSKEYMKEMVDNLKFDTLRCSVNMPGNIAVALGLDSFRAELKRALGGHIDGNKLYYFAAKYDGEFSQAVFNTSAITELRSSGSLRLIGNKKLIADMADYYDRRLFAAIKFQPEDASKALRKVIDETFSWTYFDAKVNNAEVLNKQFRNDYDPAKLLAITPAPNLLKTDSESLQSLYTAVCNFELNVKKYDFFLSYVKIAAVPLMKSIQKEYILEDE